MVAGQPVPLESDLTTPLAYFLSRPEMNLDSSATLACSTPKALLPKRLQPGRGRPDRWACTWCSPTSRARFPC